MRKPRGPQPAEIQLTDRQRSILEEIVRCHHSPQYEVTRATIILKGAAGMRSQHVADELGIHEQTVRLWRTRWAKASVELAEMEPEIDNKQLRNLVLNVLLDETRSGRPGTFTPEQICQIIALACESPELSGRPVTHWTPKDLADEAIKRGIVESISSRTVGRFFKRSGLKATSVSLLAQ